jgi:PRTRC genetic system ThiF family protein
VDIRPERRYRIEIGAVERLNITLAGCGGTGSFLALHLARLAYHLREQGGPEVCLAFVDPDAVEAQNIGRQNFCPAEVGAPKAVALMERYNRAFGLEIEAHVEPFDPVIASPSCADRVFHLVIGCVDNAAARRDIHQAVTDAHRRLWWLDGGNHRHAGQVLLGNSAALTEPEISKLGFCSALPSPAVQCPDLLSDDPPSSEPASCAELAARNVQGLMVNQAVAGWLAAYVYRLLVSRDLDMMATYFDLLSGSARSEYITAPDISREIV